MESNKRIESATGQGRLYLGSEPIANVMYGLLVRYDNSDPRSFTVDGLWPPCEVISGHVTMLGSKRNLLDWRNYTLQLEDGRSLEFFASSGNHNKATYRICPVDVQGLQAAEFSRTVVVV